MKSKTAARRRKSGTGSPRARVKVRLTGLGMKTTVLDLPPGTTVKDLVIGHGLLERKPSIRLNGGAVRLSTKLKDGDVLVAVPQTIIGGAAGRYDHLDLDECRRRMSPRDFDFFVNFVGADVLGFHDSDFAAC